MNPRITFANGEVRLLPWSSQLLLTYTPPEQRIRVTHHYPKPVVKIHRALPKRVGKHHCLTRFQVDFVDVRTDSAESYSCYVEYDCEDVSIWEAGEAAIDRITDVWLAKIIPERRTF